LPALQKKFEGSGCFDHGWRGYRRQGENDKTETELVPTKHANQTKEIPNFRILAFLRVFSGHKKSGASAFAKPTAGRGCGALQKIRLSRRSLLRRRMLSAQSVVKLGRRLTQNALQLLRLFAPVVGAGSLLASPSASRPVSRARKGNKNSLLPTLKNLRLLLFF
jgi:hypothetical protein